MRQKHQNKINDTIISCFFLVLGSKYIEKHNYNFILSTSIYLLHLFLGVLSNIYKYVYVYKSIKFDFNHIQFTNY